MRAPVRAVVHGRKAARRLIRRDQRVGAVLVQPFEFLDWGKRRIRVSDAGERLAMPAQRPAQHAIEGHAAFGEIRTEPARLPMTELGQAVVVVGTECGLRVPHEKELGH